MVTYDFQDNALWKMFSAVVNQLDLHIEKSREMTATWNLLLVFLWFAQFHPGLTFRLISRNADLVDSREDPDALFAKIDFMLEHQPWWIINESQYNRTSMHLHFHETSSDIDGSATTANVSRGGRCTAIGLDEFAFAPESYAMLRACRASSDCRIYNSTPNGAGNAFFDLKRAKIQHLTLHWSSHPEKRKGLYRTLNGEKQLVDQEFEGVVIDSEGKAFEFPSEYPFRLDGKLRSPFYDRECDRAAHPMEIAQELDIDYLGSDYQFFTRNIIDKIQTEDIRDPVVRGELEYEFHSGKPLRFVPFEDGRLQLWVNLTAEELFPENLECILGGDVSCGTGASNSALSAVDKATGEKIFEFAAPDMLAEDFATFAVAVARWMNLAYLIWDASGPSGRIFSNRVLDLRYHHIYWKTALNRITRKPGESPGYHLNAGDKAEAFGRYRAALKAGTFIQRSYEANKECLQYVQVIGSKAIEHTAAAHSQDPTGARENHGDRCVADVMANYGLYVMQSNKAIFAEPEVPQNCFAARRAAWEAKLRQEDLVWV